MFRTAIITLTCVASAVVAHAELDELVDVGGDAMAHHLVDPAVALSAVAEAGGGYSYDERKFFTNDERKTM